MQGIDGRSGILIFVAQGGGADTGRFPIMASSGVASLRQARVALRYDPGDEPHAFALDSGTVVLRRSGNRAGGDVSGSGYDAVTGTRVLARFTWKPPTVPEPALLLRPISQRVPPVPLLRM